MDTTNTTTDTPGPTSLDKRSKAYREQKLANALSESISVSPRENKSNQDKLEELIQNALKLKMVIFHHTVKAFDGTPEYALYETAPNTKSTRLAEIWYTPFGVVTKQHNIFKIIPLAQVKDTIVA